MSSLVAMAWGLLGAERESFGAGLGGVMVLGVECMEACANVVVLGGGKMCFGLADRA